MEERLDWWVAGGKAFVSEEHALTYARWQGEMYGAGQMPWVFTLEATVGEMRRYVEAGEYEAMDFALGEDVG